MVATASTYDFAAVIDGFLATKNIDGRHAALASGTIRRRALELLEKPDVRYMPAFKILDLLAALVNIAAAVSEAPQLRPNEAEALLRESLADTAPLIRQFLLDAALERARYEPLMLDVTIADAASERALVLHRRWMAMRTTHQEKSKLPEPWIDAVDDAVEAALASEDFQQFRQGPLLQLFAEMLGQARKLHHQQQPLATLTTAIAENGTLWRRYALKSARYGEKSQPTPDIRAIQVTSHTLH